MKTLLCAMFYKIYKGQRYLITVNLNKVVLFQYAMCHYSVIHPSILIFLIVTGILISALQICSDQKKNKRKN